MSSDIPPKHSKKQQRKIFEFEEYQPALKSKEKPKTTWEHNEEEEGGLEKREPKTGNAPTTAPASRPTKGWKVVDANKILTKRKYVRKHPLRGKDERSASPAHKWQYDDAGTKRRLSSPGGGLQGVPFECLPSHNDASVQAALDFLIHDIGAVAMPAARHATGFSPKAHAFLQLGFQHPTFFHAVLAFAQGYKEVATTGATQPSPMVLYHRGLATHGLYARLKDHATCADDVSILTTFLLVDNVWRYGENEIGRQHYSGLLKMIEMRGGLDQLGICGILKAMIDFAAVTDVGDSLRSPITTALPSLQYYSHPFPAHVCNKISRLPKGYTEIAVQGHLSIETMSAITSLDGWLQTDPSIRSPAPDKQIGAARRCLAASNPPRGGVIEEAVCFGIVITSMRSFHARFSRMDHPFLDRIVELGQQFDGRNNPKTLNRVVEREHIAFLTMVAVEASEKCIELQPHVSTLVDLLIKREGFARSWDGMETVIKKFFWVPFAVDSWRQCWLRQLKRRAEAEAAAAARALNRAENEAMWKQVIDPSLR